MTMNSPVINLLNHFNPSETALLDWLRPYIDDSLLDEIAAAEGGCFHKLSVVCDGYRIVGDGYRFWFRHAIGLSELD